MEQTRRSARAVLLDDRDEVLLLHGRIAEGDDRSAWYSPGGRLEVGESFVEALTRELGEELALHDVVIGPHVWTRRSTRRRGLVEVPALAYFFLVRVSRFDPDLSGIGASERDATWRWWNLDELRAATDLVLPPRMIELLPPLLSGDVPPTPIDA